MPDGQSIPDAHAIVGGSDNLPPKATSVEYQTGVTKANAYKDEPVRVDAHQSEPLPHKDATAGNQSPQESISNFDKFLKK